MGNQKQKWTAEEEEALLAGIAKHGTGKWKIILRDPDFSPYLSHRSNIDLKDKWRNLSVSPGVSKDKLRTPKVKAAAAVLAAAVGGSSSTPNLTSLNSDTDVPLTHNSSSEAVMDDQPSNAASDGKNVPRYDTLIFEALSTLGDANGSDTSAIVNFIEQRHETPPNFRRLIGSRLRRLAAQSKLEKIQNCYKVCEDPTMVTKTPKQKDVKVRNSNNESSTVSREIVEEAAITAAYKVVEAENKAYLAAEAIKELERITDMGDETDSFLEIANEIYERCSRGEIVLLA